MAETMATTNGKGGKFDWQAERKVMADEVRHYILDPFAIVAGWLRGMDPSGGNYIPDHHELSRLISLLVMGAHNELDMLSVYGGHMCPPLADILEAELKRSGGAA